VLLSLGSHANPVILIFQGLSVGRSVVAGPGDWPLIYFESIARPNVLEIPVKILPITHFSFPCSVSFFFFKEK
jgi:hypothetical protein